MELRDLFAIVFVGFVVQCSAMSISELEDFANFLKKTSQLDETLKKGTDHHDFDEDETVSDHAWEDSGKFEGDLILNDRQRRMIVEDIAEGLSRNGLRDSTKKWPDNEVIYYIQKEHFSSDQVEAIQSGIDDLARASCVKFRPYQKGDRDAVVIQGSRRGCFSQVGYQGGYQVLNLSGRHPVGRGCFRHGTVVHELLHTLGFYHMQSSPDRDDFVNVVWENIVKPARHNFRKYNAFSVSDFGVGYDYDSVLHYSRRAFSSNGQDTIVPKQNGAEIGQRVGLSDKDTQKLNKMYCDADSNSEGEENPPKEISTKKKTAKNKPFGGHGIGYHQGKTVVIKLLPEEKAATYQIVSKPAYHLFDHFSKTPQVLQTPKIEELGKTIGDFKSFNLPDIYNRVRANVPAYKKLDISKVDETYNNNVAKAEKVSNSEVNTTKTLDGTTKENDSLSNEQDELSDAFHRLSKIIKTHVYPSQLPNIGSYIFNTDYSDFVNPNKVPTINYGYPPTRSDKFTEEDKSTPEYIKSLYNNGPDSLESEKKKHNYERLQVQPEQIENIEQHHNISKEEEKSFNTAYPFTSHDHSSNRSLEIKTPAYATYEHLKDIDDYSDFYNPSTKEETARNQKYHKLFGESVPVYRDWYNKQELKQNPVNYDKKLYKDYEGKLNNHYYDAPRSSEYQPESTNDYYANSYSPRHGEAYTLFGASVPLTKDWYKVNRDNFEHYQYDHSTDKTESGGRRIKRGNVDRIITST